MNLYLSITFELIRSQVLKLDHIPFEFHNLNFNHGLQLIIFSGTNFHKLYFNVDFLITRNVIGRIRLCFNL